MDEKHVLILTKDSRSPNTFVNKTRDIQHIDEHKSIYKITFNNGRTYNYGKSKVKYFDCPQRVDTEQFIIRIKDHAEQKWDSAVIFDEYICLFQETTTHLEMLDNVELIANIANDGVTQNIIGYYRSLAEMVKEESVHIERYFTNKLNIIREDSVLNHFVNRKAPYKVPLEGELIFPFGVNPTQHSAVTNALQNPISLIQGPPGTGKTQTILNIIANLIIRNKTVAIVAGNNSATANVYEKLEKYSLHFIAAKLGNNALQKQFFDDLPQVPEIAHWKLSPEEQLQKQTDLSTLSSQIIDLLESKNRLASIKAYQNRLNLESRIFEQHFPVEPIEPERWSFSNKWATPNLLKFLAEVEHYSGKKLSWPTKLKWLYRYKIYRFADLKIITDQTIKGLVSEFYRRKSEELQQERSQLEEKLDSHNFDTLLTEYSDVSMVIFKSHIAERYQDMRHEKFSLYTYKDLFDRFLERFPTVLSTTDSIINNRSELGIFDYLIVDEASQVDLLTATLSMSCAKNIVAVGDLKQLPHIPSQQITQEVENRFTVDDGYRYPKNSLLSSLTALFSTSVPSTLLKEHYRCHPRIIDYCNQKFYNNQLIIMTEADSNPFKVVKTLPGSHARRSSTAKSLINERELDVLINEVLNKELAYACPENIGVTTPYRAQAERAQQRLTDTGVQIDTVYKYQGREKETIVFSTTASYLNKFVDNPNLLNVAVSRAQNRFILITADKLFKRQGSNIGDLIRHIEYQSLDNAIFESNTTSIFDCLYKEYAETLKSFQRKAKRKQISKYHSENLMATLLDEILEDDRYSAFTYCSHYAMSLLINDTSQLSEREKQYGFHHNTHVDFLIYNKLDKLPILAIEVDGYQFHKLNDQQKERDELKNSIFKMINLPLLRFGTESSGEREILEKALNSLLADVKESEDEQLSRQ